MAAQEELAVTRQSPNGAGPAEGRDCWQLRVSGRVCWRVVELDRENRELRRAVEILRAKVRANNNRRQRV